MVASLHQITAQHGGSRDIWAGSGDIKTLLVSPRFLIYLLQSRMRSPE